VAPPRLACCGRLRDWIFCDASSYRMASWLRPSETDKHVPR